MSRRRILQGASGAAAAARLSSYAAPAGQNDKASVLTMAVLAPRSRANEYRAAAVAAPNVRVVAADGGLAQAVIVATPLPQRGAHSVEMLRAA